MGEPTQSTLREELVGHLTAVTAQAIGKPMVADVPAILRNLDGQFVRRYLFKIEEARVFLKSYLEEIDNLSRRLEKADEATRLALSGGDALAEKRAAVEETLQKLNAHQRATAKRLFNG